MNKYIRVAFFNAAGALLTVAGAATTAHADVSRLDWMTGAWGGEVGKARRGSRQDTRCVEKHPKHCQKKKHIASCHQDSPLGFKGSMA